MIKVTLEQRRWVQYVLSNDWAWTCACIAELSLFAARGQRPSNRYREGCEIYLKAGIVPGPPNDPMDERDDLEHANALLDRLLAVSRGPTLC
jgi:hypothetical protein